MARATTDQTSGAPGAPSATGDARPVLIVLHQEHSTPGRVGQALLGRGIALDIRRPPLGDPLPETLDGHRGVVIFGGPMSANDEEAHVRSEIDWISVPLRERAPFFGICLGGQMLARQIGGSVGPHPEGKAEIGYYPLKPTQSGAALIEWPERVYQWHREGFRLPGSADVLATGDIFEQQAFRYGENAFGIQFHCELTLAMMHRWTVRGHQRLEMPGAQQRREHFAGRAIHDAPLRGWMERFIDLWLASDNR